MDGTVPPLPSRPFTEASYGVWGQHSALLPSGYLTAVRRAGGLALMVPPTPSWSPTPTSSWTASTA